MDDIEEKSSLHAEDYKVIWREFYCAALNTYKDIGGPVPWSQEPDNINEKLRRAADIADKSLQIYLKRNNMFREVALKAFK